MYPDLPDLLFEAISLLGSVSLLFGFIGLRLTAASVAVAAYSASRSPSNGASADQERAAMESMASLRKALSRVRRKAPTDDGDSSSRSYLATTNDYERGGTLFLWKLRPHRPERSDSPVCGVRSLSPC
ncbi:hypothetical protein FE782_16220 [Paenibacillus antri]|uniref:Uncharacterized protein n=1 Tax=Paenibacillus antri TaxID=2582848 RepID=A0A5R9GDK1_9BACL|nr:hypothetical protein [Paenibacillus antri]TLS51274.1 hypothetical protein FE782_16220 [Paenibacillus antri]